jgi:hypothetical protein
MDGYADPYFAVLFDELALPFDEYHHLTGDYHHYREKNYFSLCLFVVFCLSYCY